MMLGELSFKPASSAVSFFRGRWTWCYLITITLSHQSIVEVINTGVVSCFPLL
jgi:hypothetical protein